MIKIDDSDTEFEKALAGCRPAVERFVRWRIPSRSDAGDVLGEVWLAAVRGYGSLRDKTAFRAWIFSIAGSKCSDYFRRRAKRAEVPLDETRLSYRRSGSSGTSAVSETLEKLGGRGREILYLTYYLELSQSEIALRLGIPVGTVKSRLHAAKQSFRELYHVQSREDKGENAMKKLPDILPQYTIAAVPEAPFEVTWEELMGWFIVPRPGEKLSWGIYDLLSRRLSEYFVLKVTGKAVVHGIEGVSIDASQTLCEGSREADVRRFAAQLTDTHSRFLAESHYSRERGAVIYSTFLDGGNSYGGDGSFSDNWGFGEDNCGNDIHPCPRGVIVRDGSRVTCSSDKNALDVTDRCNVTIGGRTYDTIRVMDIECYNPGAASEQYLGMDGRTVLWRRFNRDDWKIDKYGRRWSELLPDNERLTVNGETYVHWYDCITEHIR